MSLDTSAVAEQQDHRPHQTLRTHEAERHKIGAHALGTSQTKLIVSICLLGAVVAVLAYKFSLSEILVDIRRFSVLEICAVFVALFGNALAATFRFKMIAAEIGHEISFRYALATVNASNLAGALFFQIPGQLAARGLMAGRGGIPFVDIVVITAYERISAAIVSALFALGGALFVYGNIYLDKSSGGAELITLVGGLIAASVAGAFVGYGQMAVRSIRPSMGDNLLRQIALIVGLAVLVQIPMQIAYVLGAHALSPQTSIANLLAASAIVMFASSIPISFAGWGLREMSAIGALGTIGISAHAALTTAVLIGIGSLLAVGIFATIPLPDTVTSKPATPTTQAAKKIDYHRVLTWLLPIAAAIFVLFQVYVPTETGLTNVNLADPVILIGGVLYALTAIRLNRAPSWRVTGLNAAIALVTLLLTISLVVGLWRHGWTSWAWIRFLGWFVLLCYGATGALATLENGKDALRIVLLTFVGAAAAIATLDIALVLLHEAGAAVSNSIIQPGAVAGFSQNRNAFALQLLLATSATIVFARGNFLRIALLGLFFAALCFAGSRSGWIACVSILGVSFYFTAVSSREVVAASLLALGVALIAVGLHYLVDNGAFASSGLHYPMGGSDFASSPAIPAIVPSETSTHERLVSIFGGLTLFAAHPVFGAGLGAFYSQLIPTNSGSPLVIHSTVVWVLAELGIVGFIILAVPALRTFITEWRSARDDQVSVLIVLCLVAFGVMSAPGDMFYQRTFWFIIGASLAFTSRNSNCCASVRSPPR